MVAIVILAIAFSTQTAWAEALSPVGKWKTIDDDTGKPKSIVEIWERGGKVYGKILRLFRGPSEDQDPKCDKCEGFRKDKRIIGMTIMWGLSRDDDEWSGGKILDPDNGKIYRCYIEVQEGGKKLKVRGYIGISLLGRTQYWLKVDD
ncbi:MAG: DUF2147 domain-containing protein [Deltaproteobacteria bacterium]|nr:DUF2147 domain-containing protein [Deltaproteobacteria bacterium]